MKLKILGTRGEIEETCSLHSKHSGFLLDGVILFDLGEREFLKYNPKSIFLTHLHPDHAYFVRWGKEEIPPTNAPIYAPEKPKQEILQASVHVLDQPIEIDKYTIIPIPTHHSKNVKSRAYLIKKGKESILYTGDLIWIDKQYHPLFENVALVITEASFIRKGGMIRKDPETHQIFGHTGIPNLIDLFKHYTQNILLIHFGAWFYDNTQKSRKTIDDLGKEKGIQIIIGYDGMEVDVARLKERRP